jgi:hypothetical protein
MGRKERVAEKGNAVVHAAIPERQPDVREEEPPSAIQAEPPEKTVDCKFSRTDAGSPVEIDANSHSGE